MLKCLWCQSLKRQATFPLSCCWLLSESLVSGKLINPLNQPNFLRLLTIVFVLAAVRCPTAPTDCSCVRTDLWSCWIEVHTWEIQWRFCMIYFTVSTHTHRSVQHCSKCQSTTFQISVLGNAQWSNAFTKHGVIGKMFFVNFFWTPKTPS